MTMFNATVIQDIKSHAQAEYPRECCGVVAGDAYHPCRNIADKPEEHFILDPTATIRFNGSTQAIIHSHCDGPPHPSKADLDGQLKGSIPWGLVIVRKGVSSDPIWFGDQAPIRDLVGRPFVYGVWDCFTLQRDYYRLHHNITMPYIPSEFEWWEREPDRDYYVKLYEQFGFRHIDRDEAREGDGFLAQIHSRAVNHAGIYLGNGLMIHHLQDQLSRREPVHRWLRHIRHFVRHKDLDV